MLSFIAKSGAQLAIAAVVGVGGLGMAATHQSDVAADNSTEIHAARPKLPSVSADAEASADAEGSAVTKAAAEVQARSKPHASRWTAKGKAAVKGTVHAVVDSKPDEPNPPSEPSNPPSNPPSDERSHERSGVNLKLDGSADLDGGGDLSIGPGGVQVGTQSHGSSGLKVSLGL
jgi:hypothetical protein